MNGSTSGGKRGIAMTYIAIAVETTRETNAKGSYRIWYLELDSQKKIVGIGSKSKEELIQNLFQDYQLEGETKWRALLKDSEETTPIEMYDFISKDSNANTHFGNLPTLSQFQHVLHQLHLNLELKPLAS